MLSRICLSTQRFLLSAWVGAAVLFVVTSVAEQQFDGFASSIKNQLAMIRFPKYYAMGFFVLLISLGCSTIRVAMGARNRSDVAVLVLLAVANLTMVVDFTMIYRPLHEIMVDLLRPRDDDFQWYHQASKYINSVGILLAVVAAILVCREPSGTDAEAQKGE